MATILLASIPARVVPAAVVSQDPTSGNVLVSWTAPDDGGEIIDGFTIEFQDSEEEWTQISECTSASVSTISCDIPMPVFLSSQLNLLEGDFISV